MFFSVGYYVNTDGVCYKTGVVFWPWTGFAADLAWQAALWFSSFSYALSSAELIGGCWPRDVYMFWPVAGQLGFLYVEEEASWSEELGLPVGFFYCLLNRCSRRLDAGEEPRREDEGKFRSILFKNVLICTVRFL